jgi:hypothetical protein
MLLYRKETRTKRRIKTHNMNGIYSRGEQCGIGKVKEDAKKNIWPSKIEWRMEDPQR